MKQVYNETTLLERIFGELNNRNEKEIAILAGHFPLRINPKSKSIYEELNEWGDFSTYTLELGMKIGKYVAEELGKKPQFLFLCDDQSYRDSDKKLLDTEDSLTDAQLDNKWRSLRNALYQSKSDEKAELPELYQQLMKDHDFHGEHIMKHNHGKSGRDACLYFSEAVLRDPTRTPQNTRVNQHVNACSREYITLIESEQFLAEGKRPYLVSFIPQKCSHFICDAVDLFIQDFKGMHVFMETVGSPNQKDIYKKESGVWLKQNE